MSFVSDLVICHQRLVEQCLIMPSQKVEDFNQTSQSEMRHDHGEFLDEIQKQIVNFQLGISQTVNGLGDRFSSMNEDSKKYYRMYRDLLNRLTTLNRYGDDLCELNRMLNADWTRFEKENFASFQRIKEERGNLEVSLTNLTEFLPEIYEQIENITGARAALEKRCEEMEATEAAAERRLQNLNDQLGKSITIDITAIQSSINKLESDIKARQHDVDLVQKSVANLERRRRVLVAVPSLASRLGAFKKTQSEVSLALETVHERAESIKRSIETKRKITETLKAGLSELLALHDDRNKLITERKSFRKEKSQIDAEFKARQTELNKCEGIIASISEEIDALDHQNDEISKQIASTEIQIHEYDNNPINLQWTIKEEQLAEILKEIETQSDTEIALNSELHRKQTTEVSLNIDILAVPLQTASEEKSLAREIVNTQETIRSINTEIEKQHEILNVLVAEQLRLEGDMRRQLKRMKYYSSQTHNKTENRQVDTRIVTCIGEIEEIVRARKAEMSKRRKILREKQACIDQLFATRRFKTVTSVESDDLEPLMELMASRSKYYKLICQSCSWITELYNNQKSKLASLTTNPSTIMKEWNTSLDSAYPRAEDTLILAQAYLIE